MDKTWMTKSRLSVEYEQGVREFLEFAFSNTMSNQILCPCRRCVNSVLLTRDEVYEHLIIHGILKLYKNWYEHGEQPSSSNANIEQHDDLSSQFNVNEILEDEFGMPDDNMRDETTSPAPSTGGLNNEAGQFFKFLDDANKELYPGCARFTKLTFIVRLYHIKCLSGWSNKSLDLLLALLKEALPEGETLPESFYELKKIIKDLGLDYKKIDACPNDCMLFWKEAAHDETCKVCGACRWKQMQKDLTDEAQMNTLSSQLPEDSQSSSTVRDKIFSQVMGEDNHGRCRMYGLGVSLKDLHGPHPTRRELMESCERLESQNRRLESQNRRLESQNSLMENDITDLKNKVDILIQAAGRQSGVEGGVADILSAISKKLCGVSFNSV